MAIQSTLCENKRQKCVYDLNVEKKICGIIIKSRVTFSTKCLITENIFKIFIYIRKIDPIYLVKILFIFLKRFSRLDF